jgi:large subunit ribosomal protein L6
MRSLIQNMVTGVTIGFHKLLEINGVGYKAMMEKGKLRLQLGYSHPVDLTPPEGVKIELVDPTHIKVFGIDKEVVGNVAAKIRAIRRADPYKSKGIKYVGERIRRKAGKKGV